MNSPFPKSPVEAKAESLPRRRGVVLAVLALLAAQAIPLLAGPTGPTAPQLIPALLTLALGALFYRRAERVVDHAQAELRQREVDLQRLTQASPLLMWALDSQGNCTWVNRSWLEFTGQAFAATAADGWLRPVHGDERKGLAAALAEALPERRPFKREVRLCDKSGAWRWVVIHASPRLDEGGNFTGYNGLCWDVSEGRQALAELAQNERLIRAIHDTSSAGIMLTDRSGRIIHANRHLAEMFGQTLEELLLADYLAHIHPTERETASERLQSILDGHSDYWEVDRRYLRKDGSDFWGRLCSRPLRDENGTITGVVGTITDISDQRATEQYLRLVSKVFESCSEGVLITDAKNTILQVNQAFTRITGYMPHEVVGKPPRVLSSGQQSMMFYAEMWRQLLQDGRWSGEIWNRRRNGEVYPEWISISAVRDDKDEITHFVAVFSDITERKQSESRVRYLAQYDYLTNLPNRALLYDRLTQAHANAERYARRFALLFIDLDNFKQVNDNHNHDTGDELLRQVAARLRDNIRSADTVARHGGDEFVVLIAETQGAQEVAAIAQKLLELLAAPYYVFDHLLTVTPSIGVAIYPEDGSEIDTLIRAADTAMYGAKGCGRNAVVFNNPGVLD
ncbi:MAG TPA: PAS domain S-box protein [Rhodocyclaceae bacterium]